MELKALGIVRRMDELGRIVIPMEVRRANAWQANQPLEMFADRDGGLYVKAYGKDAEKDALVEQLIELKQRTSNPEVFEMASKTIQFLNERM